MTETIYLEPDCGSPERCWSLNPDGDCDCGAPWVKYVRADICEAEIARLKAQAEKLAGALGECVGCFDAAYAEGLDSQLEYGSDVGSLSDLVQRRLLYAHPVAVGALADYRGE